MKKDEWMKKVAELKNKEADLSRDEDLSIALMNLVSLEEHFYFTAMKTGNKTYLDFLHSTREMRKTFLEKIVKNPKGEEWCISKHLLAASMRLYEVGCKEKENGEQYFQAAFDLWSLFFSINLDLVEVEEITHISEDKKMNKLSTLMKKVVDCCKEW